MAKKGNGSLNLLYVIGLALVVVGFCLPLATTKAFGMNGGNGFSYIDTNFAGICALLVFASAVLGLIASFISIPNSGLIKLISLIVCIAAGVVLYLNMGDLGKSITKAIFNPGIGFWCIIAGWVVSAIGYVVKK